MSEEKKLSPVLIAGPCLAESYGLLEDVAGELCELTSSLGWDYYFKASFDKANRSAVNSARGPGLDIALDWFTRLKKNHSCKILTDIHETHQASLVAEVCHGLQIPAFLCRQTEFIICCNCNRALC